MKPKLAIWGAGGHAIVVADIVRLSGAFELVGFIDDVNPRRRNFCGSHVLGGRDQLSVLIDQDVKYMLVAFGNCLARSGAALQARQKGFILPTAVHPSSIIAKDVKVGEGTVIAAGAIINPGCIIGKNVIINTGASIDHECILEDGCHICPGVHIAGAVIVEQNAWVGIGSTIIERLHIGAEAVIGAGAVVLHDIPKGSVAYGVPARLIK